jgi:squalene-hopene/tetraprenyl-beta-curcumene cyclase
MAVQHFVACPAVAALAALLVVGPAAVAQDKKSLDDSVGRAIRYLESVQADDGSFSKQNGPAITALVATGLMRNGRGPSDPMVAKALKYLLGFVQPTGGIHGPKSPYGNYETCVAVMCLSLANKDGRYDKVLKNADKYLKGLQIDEGDGKQKSDFAYGGAPYGEKKRPDLSNTQFFIEALRELGNSEDDENVQKALIFVNRCQNLESEHNTTPYAAKVNDGGFYYTPVEGQKGDLPNGGLRSIATMTYAGLKSMLYAGVKAGDPRVKATVQWVTKNYDVKSNPGQGDGGVYYYYHTFAKALDAIGMDEVADAAGTKHNWRKELADELARRQRANGSWVNDNTRFLEGDANLTTAYGLLVLSYCKPRAVRATAAP